MSLQSNTTRSRPSRRSRIAAIGILAGLMVAFTTAAAVQASHAAGELDCGSAGAYAIDGRELPTGIDSPVPWSGLFLLEGTTRVFRAHSIDGQRFPFSRPAADRFPGEVITCTLTSSGFGFPDGYWTLTGVLTP